MAASDRRPDRTGDDEQLARRSEILAAIDRLRREMLLALEDLAKAFRLRG